MKKSLHTMRRPACRCRQRRAACAHRSPAQRAAARTNHSAAFPLPTPVHYRLHPRPHRIVLHSLFAASHRAERPPQPQRITASNCEPIASLRIRPSQLPRRAERPPQPQRITASNRKPIASFRIRPSQLPRRAERPPQRIAALICEPIASFRIRPSQLPAAPLAPSSAIPVILRPSPCRFSRLDSPGASSDPQNRKSGRDIHPCPQ